MFYGAILQKCKFCTDSYFRSHDKGWIRANTLLDLHSQAVLLTKSKITLDRFIGSVNAAIENYRNEVTKTSYLFFKRSQPVKSSEQFEQLSNRHTYARYLRELRDLALAHRLRMPTLSPVAAAAA